ncbi:MAG: trypsin-like peptidase domain-containing protein [Lactobacillales bacterium]|jgi:serine protease Do|nr:trypsin-like peptidase domain-containing protein [Lactobacillales bacterium]
MVQENKKIFLVGLAGGVLGALLIVGGTYVLNDNLLNNQTTSVKNAGNNTVSKNVYKNTSNVTEVVKKVQPTVVSVVNLQSSKAAATDFGSLFDDSESEKSSDSGELEPISEGSGVIYKKEGDKAYLVTNNHVVDGQQGLEVILSDGTKVTGELVGRDVYSDLAVIRIPADKVTVVAEFADSSKVAVGEPAIAIGSPLGSKYSNSATEGIVSAVERQVTFNNAQGEAISMTAIQTDAAINPGNSGGPLLNIEGQVIGINSNKNAGEAIEGMGFANSSNDVVTVVNQLEEKGKVERPGLGITMDDLSKIPKVRIEKYLKLPSEIKEGIVILTVAPATPAEAAGMKQYDVITEVDGKAVKTSVELQSALYKHKVGDTIEITYYRKEDKKTTKVKLTIDKQAITQKSTNQ